VNIVGSVPWQLFCEILGRSVGIFFKGRAVQGCFTLEDLAVKLSRNSKQSA
jgi:hypothetical protein